MHIQNKICFCNTLTCRTKPSWLIYKYKNEMYPTELLTWFLHNCCTIVCFLFRFLQKIYTGSIWANYLQFHTTLRNACLLDEWMSYYSYCVAHLGPTMQTSNAPSVLTKYTVIVKKWWAGPQWSCIASKLPVDTATHCKWFSLSSYVIEWQWFVFTDITMSPQYSIWYISGSEISLKMFLDLGGELKSMISIGFVNIRWKQTEKYPGGSILLKCMCTADRRYVHQRADYLGSERARVCQILGVRGPDTRRKTKTC